MRGDARLHDFVSEGKRKGRRPKVGKRLSKPADGDWKKMNVQWYQGKIKEVIVSARDCLWLAGKESAVITLKAIWVQLRPGDEVILMSTGLNLDAVAVIEGYVKRWNIEVTFRECREYLGVETQRQWSDLAIARTTPLLFALYTIITMIGNAIYFEKGIMRDSTAWYTKTQITFSDLHEAVRQEMGDISDIVNSLISGEFNNKSELEEPPSEKQKVMGF